MNIAPLQLAGLLAGDVLTKAADAKKAIADRARWRSDERRWVREGKLLQLPVDLVHRPDLKPHIGERILAEVIPL